MNPTDQNKSGPLIQFSIIVCQGGGDIPNPWGRIPDILKKNKENFMYMLIIEKQES